MWEKCSAGARFNTTHHKTTDTSPVRHKDSVDDNDNDDSDDDVDDDGKDKDDVEDKENTKRQKDNFADG